MIETISSINQVVNDFIWGVPAMVCIIGVGILLSVRTNFIQIRKFPYAIKTTVGRMFKKKEAALLTTDMNQSPRYFSGKKSKVQNSVYISYFM